EAAISATCRPVPSEPVKVIALTSGERIMVSPTLRPGPISILNTPAGKPEREMISAKAQAEEGTSSAGLNTTVLPKHNAGAIFQAGIAIGKFHGLIIPTTPTAWV